MTKTFATKTHTHTYTHTYMQACPSAILWILSHNQASSNALRQNAENMAGIKENMAGKKENMAGKKENMAGNPQTQHAQRPQTHKQYATDHTTPTEKATVTSDFGAKGNGYTLRIVITDLISRENEMYAKSLADVLLDTPLFGSHTTGT